ncbi:transmembrane protein 176B [Ornithorhynchus anatinus]|uniref:Transmembrane protein 176B n=1 Tax=Ornithorhynchus anatinus TaxID=9258 RepID=F6VYZ7_ORNAN|nr:transmembrane protein 176B [Ornithorhynchus anatinus]
MTDQVSGIPTSTVEEDGMEVASGDAGPAQLNIHIHQESALAQLVKSGCSLFQRGFKSTRQASASRARIGRAQLALGVTQVVLGTVSGALGVLLYLGPWIMLSSTGCAFWPGAVAIAAGAGAIVHEKRRSRCWGGVSVLMTLLSASAALAALILCINSFVWQPDGFYYMDSVCESPSPTSWTPRYSWQRQSGSNWRQENCRKNMVLLVKLFGAVRGMMLAVFALLLAGSLASLGLGLRCLCCRADNLEERDRTEKLLAGNSPPPSPHKE